jgi:hypothetical protein
MRKYKMSGAECAEPAPRSYNEAMSDLRDLLIDLRIELRHLKADFQKSSLRHRVDEAVSMLGRLPDATLEGLLRTSGKGIPATAEPVKSDDAVWREVVADLRGRHPAVFDLIQREVDVRRGIAPAEAASPEAVAGEPASPLLLDVAEPIVVAAPAVVEPEGDVPTEEILRLVAEGVRGFSDPQREWCMGEAMVVLEFQLSPQELLGRGDQVLARVILTGAID